MFKKIFLAFFAVSALVISGHLLAQYPPLTPDLEQSMEAQMNSAIANAEAYVKQTEYNATRTDMAPTWNTKLEMQNAIIQLEVKKTLVNNFKNTQSLRSPLVQQKLIAVLNLKNITTADLADLQNLVLQEKANIQAFDSQQSIVPQTTTAPTTTTSPQATQVTQPAATPSTTTTPAVAPQGGPVNPLPSNVIIPQ